MTTFTVTVFLFGEGIDRHYDVEVIDDDALRKRLDLAEGMSGGLKFATEDNLVLVDDDFDALTNQVLVALPAALREGNGLAIELYHDGGVIEVTLDGDTVTFDFGNTVLTAPRGTVLAALDDAAARLAKIRDLVGPEA
jgi:hypothetical protein